MNVNVKDIVSVSWALRVDMSDRRTPRDRHGNPLVRGRLYFCDTVRGRIIVRLKGDRPTELGCVDYEPVFPEPVDPLGEKLDCFTRELTPLEPAELGRQYHAFLRVVEEYLDQVKGG